jgi:curved DNA-binding protein CbpA
MAATGNDPYQTLGVRPSASDDELRDAYRHLVQLHHPDHNNGSPESARRFEEVQEAYARVRKLRQQAPQADKAPPKATVDPNVEARLADLEHELRDAHAARERARRAAAEAAAASFKRPSDEELGYVHTDDTLGKLLDDARAELSERLSGAREHSIAQRVTDLIDELTSKTRRDPPSGSRD